MAAKYKSLCMRCKKNYVTVTYRNKFPICYECQEKEMQGEITDPEMKKMFDIPDEFYKENSFLCSIKINYLKFGSLTERQIEAFKKTVDKMTEAKEKKEEEK